MKYMIRKLLWETGWYLPGPARMKKKLMGSIIVSRDEFHHRADALIEAERSCAVCGRENCNLRCLKEG